MMKKTVLLIALIVGFLTFHVQAGFSDEHNASRQAALTAFKKGQYKQAADLFAKLLEYYPTHYDLRAKYGYALMKLQKYKESEEQFEQIVSQSKNKKLVAYAEHTLALLQEKLKKPEEKTLVVRVTQGMSGSSSSTPVLIETESTSEEPKTEETGTEKPASEAVQKLMAEGYFLLKTEDYQQSIDVFNKVIVIDPENKQVYLNRGIAYFKQNKYQEALDDYDKATELAPKDPQMFYNRGIIYNKQKQYDRALQELDKAIELASEPKLLANCYNERALVNHYQDKPDDAIDDATKALQYNPNHWQAYTSRGLAYNKKSLSEQAIGDFKKAIEINAGSALAHLGLGAAHKALADCGSANEAFEKACQLGLSEACTASCP